MLHRFLIPAARQQLLLGVMVLLGCLWLVIPATAQQTTSPWDTSWIPQDPQAVIARIDAILNGTGLAGQGANVLQYAQQYGVNPAFALAMFRKEATFAAPSSRAYSNKNPGNIIATGNCRGLPANSSCTGVYGEISTDGRFGIYANMTDGVHAYFKLLNSEYKPGTKRNCLDLACVIRIYCPPSDCDTDRYIAQITEWMQEYQRLLSAGGIPAGQNSTATLLVIDVSGSMSENWHGGVKIESAKSAADQIVNMLQQESQVASTAHRLGLATFTTDAALNLPLTSDYTQARSAINSLTPQQSTNLGAGLTVANQALGQASTNESKVVILLSDGLTNTGLPADQILSGPVQEAVNAGTCIYTVGFGDPGSFDEDLLRRIAAASGCGQYYYATDVNELQRIYIRVRHVSTGNLLAELSGTVAQGQTVQAGTVNVPSGQDELAISLNWPGSALDLQLTDPQGKAVDQAYPGANIATYSNLVYALIQKPISGTWQVAVYGREVPEGTTIFDALASVRPSPVLPTPEPTQPAPAPAATLPTSSPGPAIVVMLAVIAAGGVGVYALVKRQPRRAPLTPGAEQGLASLLFTSGSLAGQTTSLPTSGLVVGRGSACNLRLDDPAVSRQHARIRYAAGAWFIQDLNSSGGTFVNGQRVQAARLNPGDQIRIGSSTVIFRV